MAKKKKPPKSLKSKLPKHSRTKVVLGFRVRGLRPLTDVEVGEYALKKKKVPKGKWVNLSRRFHSKPAANDFVPLARKEHPDYIEIDIKEDTGFDTIEATP